MDKKADLIVKLMAGDTVVDQSTDVGLWQRVLAEIRGVAAPTPNAAPPGVPPGMGRSEVPPPRQGDGSPLHAFAAELGITLEELEGALSPSTDAPYITLDQRSWETLKRNTPQRGSKAVSAAGLAATALSFWQRHSKIPDVTTQMVRATLETIHLDDVNAARSISNCAWLQDKGGRVVPHPSRKSGGFALLKAYCTGGPPSEAA